MNLKTFRNAAFVCAMAGRLALTAFTAAQAQAGTPADATFGVNTESTYDWQRRQWTVPLNVFVQQLLKEGNQRFALQLGRRCYAEGPSGGPEWGLRFQIHFLFPK
jgi:hypothetical protein